MSQLVPGLRLLRFALRLVLDTVDDGREETIQPSLDVVYLNFFQSVPDRLLALFAGEPTPRALGQFNVILDRKRYHRLPEFAVVAAEEHQVHHVTTATTPIAPPASRWVDVERGCFVLVIWNVIFPKYKTFTCELQDLRRGQRYSASRIGESMTSQLETCHLC